MKSLPAAAAAIATAGSIALGAGAASAASASEQPVRTYIPTPAQSQLVYRPGRLVLAYGPEILAKDIHWQYWHRDSAQGTAHLIGCDVTCVSLGRHVTLHFYDRKYLRMNASEFLRLHIIHGHGVAPYWHWVASADTWEG